MSAATGPGDPGAVTPAQVLAGLLLAVLVLWLLAPFAGNDPPAGLTASNAPSTDEGFNLANARERVLGGRFATGDVDRSLTNGAYSALAAATLGGSVLMLEHGRLALVEATVVALLAGALVLAARAAERPSAAAGAGLGLLVAAAVSVKANAVAPGMVLLAVILVAAAARRDRRALSMGLAGLGTLVLAAVAWLAAVGLPNWDRLATSVRIWPTVEYLGAPAAVAGRVGRYVA